jgi:hypothetical protein
VDKVQLHPEVLGEFLRKIREGGNPEGVAPLFLYN